MAASDKSEPAPASIGTGSASSRVEVDAAERPQSMHMDAAESAVLALKMAENSREEEDRVLADQAGRNAGQMFEISLTYERLKFRRSVNTVALILTGVVGGVACATFAFRLLAHNSGVSASTAALYASVAAFIVVFLFVLGQDLSRTLIAMKLLRRSFREQREALADLDRSRYFVEKRLLDADLLYTLHQRLSRFSDGAAAERA